MSGHLSAYAALGLRPGADRAQIDAAYRRLIKVHHPDRTGGDARRAAEINRAYRELRDLPPELPPIRMHQSSPAPRRRRRIRFNRILVAVGMVAALLAISDRDPLTAARSWSASAVLPLLANSRSANAAAAMPFADLGEPLSDAAIEGSVADALRLHSNGDSASILQYSHACEAEFRDHPSIIWFDTCAAYDEAIVALESRDPMMDSGPFDAAEVTGREMGAARLLSSDAVMADARIHQIRDRVEYVLITNAPSPEVTIGNTADSESANVVTAN